MIALLRLLWPMLTWLSRLRVVRAMLAVAAAALAIGALAFAVTWRFISPADPQFATLLAAVYAAIVASSAVLVVRAILRRRERARRFGALLALTPPQFEAAVASILRNLGYRQIRVSGGAGDLSVDIACRDRDGATVAVQCKRYAPGARIGSPAVQSFIGMISVHHRADRGIFVTTASFTAPAIELAAEHNIELIDGAGLMRILDSPRRKRVAARAA